MVKIEVGVMLTGGLLALAGCGGGTRVVTKTVTVPRGATVTKPTRARQPAGPSAAAIAAVRTFDASAIAANVEQAAVPVGDAVFVTAAAAAAGTIATEARPAGTNPSAPRTAPTRTPARVVSGQASGQYAVAYTNGTFQHPSQIVMNVAASPPQTGSIDWNIVCFELSGGIGRKAGRATLQLPTTKTLPLPAPSHTCIGSANVQLSKTGTVSISLSG